MRQHVSRAGPGLRGEPGRIRRLLASAELTQEIEQFLTERMPHWKKEKPQAVELKVAVMGCVVNGPGESKHANIGISLPGTFEDPKAPVYIDGEHSATLKGDGLVDEFKQILSDYVKRTYAPRVAAGTASEE